ncbi:hypothetical protein ASG37_06080 [Sphingomonas sp. Leaf407]|nr:hypothetical protein ASE97_16015 [Sphingomonas sp. Leaf42]KQT30622.1 hypothetical protein ASG37_06080 [Sphingomonas sp. Leaf407]
MDSVAIFWSIVRMMLALIAMTVASGAEAGDAVHVPIAIRLYEGDRLIATPIVYTPYGQATTIRLDRPGGYAISVRPERATIAGKPAAQVAVEVARQQAGRWTTVSRPVLLVGCGGDAAMAIDRPGGTAVRIELAIDPAAIDPSCAKR